MIAKYLTDPEVLSLMRGDSLLNSVRRMISTAADVHGANLTVPEVRRLEFALAQRIIDYTLAYQPPEQPESLRPHASHPSTNAVREACERLFDALDKIQDWETTRVGDCMDQLRIALRGKDGV